MRALPAKSGKDATRAYLEDANERGTDGTTQAAEVQDPSSEQKGYSYHKQPSDVA